MNNLTTRKIVLGTLMVLVLAFSVQGIADALTFGTSRSGDFNVVLPNQDFTISFQVTPGSDTTPITSAGKLVSDDRSTRIDSAGYQVFVASNNREYRLSTAADALSGTYLDTSGTTGTSGALYVEGGANYTGVLTKGNVVDASGDPVYIQTGTSPNFTYPRATAAPNARISDENRYHYNEEAISISIPANLTLKKVGRYTVNKSGSHTMNEMENSVDENKLTSGTIALTYTASAAGEYNIAIMDMTDASDRPRDAARSLTFTVYVVNFDKDVTSATVEFGDGTPMADKVEAVGRSSQIPQPIGLTVSGGASHVPLVFRVEGGGQVYARETGATRPTDKNREGPRSSGTREHVLSSAAEVYLDMKGRTNTVTVYPRGTNPNNTGKSIIYVNRYANLTITHGDGQTGAPGGRLEEYLGVRVTDSGGNRIPGMVVRFPATGTDSRGKFIPFPGTTVYVNPDTNALVSSAEAADKEFVAEPSKHVGGADAMMVKTDSSGEAKVYYAFDGTTEPADYTISPGLMYAPTVTADFTATAATVGNTRTANLEILSGNPQSGAKGKKLGSPLVVIARSTGGHRIPDVIIQFRTVTGILSPAPGTDQPTDAAVGGEANNASSGQQIYVITGANGEAGVTYNVGQTTVARDVIAEVRFEAGTTQYDFAIDRVVFNVNGRAGTSQPSQPSQPAAVTNTITLTLSSTTGEPGDEIDVTVSTSSATPDFVVIDDGDFSASDFDDLSGRTPHETTLTLPDEEGEYDFFAVGPGGVTSNEVTVTVETGILGEISISQIGTPSNGAQSFSITVVDTDSARISGALTVRVSGSGFTTRNVDTLNGVGNARLTLPTAASLYTLTASAEGYTSGTTQVRIAGTGQQQVADEDEEEVEEEVTVAAEPDSIEITGPSTRSGTVNEELEAALIVRVLDDDGDGLEGARVFYRVISGRGRLSARGNGRAIGVVTDSSGYARAVFTPLDGGTITVRANTDDLSATVTFTITTGSAPSASGARDSGTGGTPGAISPVVHVVAASRPPMLWVDGGAIYGLVGANAQRFAPSVDNALNIAVGGSKVYWTEKTGENSGTINSANLNGSDVTELVSVRSVPMGIAVDTAGRKLYWTASSGKIKRANLDGSGRENVVPGGLDTPMDLALADGNVYWTQGNGSVRFASLTGQIRSRPISTGSDTPGSLAISGGKVYWTEKTAASAGTINSANLDGTDVRELTSIRSVPMGIAVDTARSKLYWTASSGKVKQANLNGSGAKNVVSGLGSPGDMVLSNSITAPAGAGSSAGSGTTASDSKYDVNGDGSVNNADSDAITVAIAAGATDAKYDVNGDGTVNVFDLVEIIANRDPGAAGAPTLFGMKMTAVQIDHLQEQIDLLIATNDRSPAAMRVLVYLQQLIVTARPEKTQLLANYPNPFNPETWIPYELATDTNVRLTIYNTQGVVIRTMQFGHQSAGYYTGRDRAAYWDGRNALGEQVASGLYFYQLETDEMSLMRKMVILK